MMMLTYHLVVSICFKGGHGGHNGISDILNRVHAQNIPRLGLVRTLIILSSQKHWKTVIANILRVPS